MVTEHVNYHLPFVHFKRAPNPILDNWNLDVWKSWI
jgi:hypothetical protein